MGTRFRLEPELVERLERVARERKQDLATTLREMVKVGLDATEAPPLKPRFCVEPHDFGFRPEFDLDRMNRLADELEVEEVQRKAKLTRISPEEILAHRDADRR